MFGYSSLSSKYFSFFYIHLMRKSVFGCERMARKYLCQAADSLANLVDSEYEVSPIDSSTNIQSFKHRKLQHLFTVQSKVIMKSTDFKESKILTLGPHKAEERRHSLVELGFRDITISEILSYNSLMKCTAAILHKRHILPKDINPLETLVLHLNVPSDFLETLRFRYSTIDVIPLSSIKKIVFQEYISWFFKISTSEAFLFLETCPSIRNRSLSSIFQVWNIFLHEIGYSLIKIKSNKNLLKIDPLNLKRILSELTQIGGLDIRDFIRKYPSFALVSCDNIKEVNKILTENGISDIQILKCANVYNLDAAIVQSRFKTIENLEEFGLLKNHSRFLFLIYFFTRSMERLEYLKSAGYSQISIHLLTASNNKFQKWCSSIQVRITPRECIQLLANIFFKSPQEVSLQLKQHPKSSSLNLENIKVIKLIEENGFSKNQIYSALPIILYEPLFIEEHLKTLSLLKEMQPYCDWITHTNALHVVIYLIELSYGFTWEGVLSAKIKKVRQEIIFKNFSTTEVEVHGLTKTSENQKTFNEIS